MRTRHFTVACLGVLAMALAATLAVSAPQDYNKDAYAKDYVRDVLTQLDQWTKSLPQDYNQAILKPPIDASKLSPVAKSGADELRNTVKQMVGMMNAPDLLTNAQFKQLVDKAHGIAKETNAALGTQRWPAPLQSDWGYVRVNLNYLFRVYNAEALADLSPQPAGGGRGGRRGPAAAGPPGGAAPGAAAAAIALQGPATVETVAGFVVDQSCAGRRAMWQNANCVETCIKGGDRAVVVTEDGKIYQISNIEKVNATFYGKQISMTGKTDGEVMIIDSLKLVE